MSRSHVWARFGVPLLALGLLMGVAALTTPPENAVARVSAEAPAAPPPGESPDDNLLARSVRYSEPFAVDQATRVRVNLSGAGDVHVALVSEDDTYVREAFGQAPGEVRFAALEAGTWVMRLRALPGAQNPEAEALVGGQSWTLFGLAAALLFLPFIWPYRRAPVETWRRYMSAER